MRLFVALAIPEEVRTRLEALMNGLREEWPASPQKKPRWTNPENLHVTLKFIGSVPEAKLEPICEALSKVHAYEPVHLRFRGLGFFPNEKRARVFWAGIETEPSLTDLAGAVEKSLEKLGVAAEERAFTPHLTLARLDGSRIGESTLNLMHKNVANDFGGLRANEFHLMESKLSAAGAQYTCVSSFTFVKAEA